MTASQGKTQITEFIRDIELMAGRFPDVNCRGIIDIFWWGIYQSIRVEVVQMGAHPERLSLDTIVKCAVRVEDSIVEAELQKPKESPREGHTWGRFANQTSRPKPYRPPCEANKQYKVEGKERVCANAVTPQPQAGPSRTEGGHPRHARRGKKISKERRDQLRAEGKCFQCEQQGHSQRDCLELNMMRPLKVQVNNVNVAQLERLSKAREKADLQVGHISIVSNGTMEDDATPEMKRAYKLCTAVWGEDE